MTKKPRTANRPNINPVEFITHYQKGKDAMIITLKNVRLAFPDLWVPTAFEEGQEKKYGATFLIPKNDPQLKMLKQAILNVATEQWKTKAQEVLKAITDNPQKYCLQDGDTGSRTGYDGYAGHMALSAKNKKRPTVKDRDTSQLSESDGRPYAGCYVNASIEIWAQENKYGKAMRASLRGIQFVRDGDQFTAGTVAGDDEFEDLGSGADADADAGDDNLA